MPHRPIDACRLCRGEQLDTLLELGDQHLTGVFPADPDAPLDRGPLSLGRCAGCGLVQLLHSFDPSTLYGENYGYRSGLNASMVAHLRTKIEALRDRVGLLDGDIVVDIGSNDGTTLGCLPRGLRLVGFDPSSDKFAHYYRDDIRRIGDFFSADRFKAEFGVGARARLITAIAMFYDLEDPLSFMRQIEQILAPDGLWHFEQSYLPAMLATNSYDTICHEHLEYYAVRQIKWMTDRAGLRIVDIGANDVNGGSFAITVARADGPHAENTAVVDAFLERERQLGLDGLAPFRAFRERVFEHRDALVSTLSRLKDAGRSVVGYGASTKGNVILQFCKLDTRLLPVIAEVNSEKFGRFTPGSRIPIVSEADAKARKPDTLLVLPWHFRPNFLEREAAFLRAGGSMLFPLPQIEEVRA